MNQIAPETAPVTVVQIKEVMYLNAPTITRVLVNTKPLRIEP